MPSLAILERWMERSLETGHVPLRSRLYRTRATAQPSHIVLVPPPPSPCDSRTNYLLTSCLDFRTSNDNVNDPRTAGTRGRACCRWTGLQATWFREQAWDSERSG